MPEFRKHIGWRILQANTGAAPEYVSGRSVASGASAATPQWPQGNVIVRPADSASKIQSREAPSSSRAPNSSYSTAAVYDLG
jgi:hypothetical protein